MNITSGKIKSAQKIVVYGPEGIGKSTFAAQFPNPLFIDTEGSTKNLDVMRFDKPTSWAILIEQTKYVINNPTICKTLVIDTMDWAEQLCIESVLSTHDKKSIEEFGYGTGYVYVKEEFGRYLNLLDEVIGVGVNVGITAHTQIRKFEQPDELGSYDRYELKLGKKTSSQTAPLLKEWADMILFANYKTLSVAIDKDGKKHKAQGGSRTMYTVHHPCWDAKNRHGLADELPFDYNSIAHIFNDVVVESPKTHSPIIEPPTKTIQKVVKEKETPQKIVDSNIPKALSDLMALNNVKEDEIRLVVSHKGYYPYDMPVSNYPLDFINGVLIGAWDQVYNMIQDLERLPFGNKN